MINIFAFFVLKQLFSSMILSCILLNRNGKRIFYKDYNRSYNAFEKNPEEETKLICGFILSMNDTIKKFSPDK